MTKDAKELLADMLEKVAKGFRSGEYTLEECEIDEAILENSLYQGVGTRATVKLTYYWKFAK